jgi:hypothetical protein
MKVSILSATLIWNLVLTSFSLAEGNLPPSADPVQTAFDKLVQASTHTDWPAEADARKELASLGHVVVPKLTEAARAHSEARVRRSCYELLTTSFAEDERTVDTLIGNGLLDQDAGIRYHCAFLLGDLKVQRAGQALQRAFEGATGKDDQLLRYTLAKSLAQLGRADVLSALYAAVSDDAFLPRHIGNIGLKGLSGKNLEDFEGYHYAEGAFVVGGHELTTPFDALTSAERKAGRFRAAAAYFQWLKGERPELYKCVTYPMNSPHAPVACMSHHRPRLQPH